MKRPTEKAITPQSLGICDPARELQRLLRQQMRVIPAALAAKMGKEWNPANQPTVWRTNRYGNK